MYTVCVCVCQCMWCVCVSLVKCVLCFRVKEKPYIELKDSDGRPDDEVAKEVSKSRCRTGWGQTHGTSNLPGWSYMYMYTMTHIQYITVYPCTVHTCTCT